MIRTGLIIGALGAMALAGSPACAQQQPGRYGERVGNTYLPSTHDSNCGGLICSSVPTDPANPMRVIPPPACEGLLCGMTPYGMQRPYTAADAERDRAAAQARAAAAQPVEPAAAPIKRVRKARKAKVARAMRTPAPAQAEAAQ